MTLGTRDNERDKKLFNFFLGDDLYTHNNFFTNRERKREVANDYLTMSTMNC